MPADVAASIGTEASTGVTPSGTGWSRASGDLTFIAIPLSGPGVDSEVGVWVRTDSVSSGLVLSVNPIAKALTVWPDAAATDFGVQSSDPGVEAVQECLAP